METKAMKNEDNLSRPATRVDNALSFEFDFDEWRLLHDRDPEAFECRRRQWVDQIIDSAPVEQRRRLRGLMFQVDMERRRAANPVDSCMRISALMWDRFGELKSHLNAMASPSDITVAPRPLRERPGASVLSFRQRDGQPA